VLAGADAEAQPHLLVEARRIDAERIDAIEGLDRDHRARVMGLGERGRQELNREITLLALSLPIYRRDLRRRLAHWPTWAAQQLKRGSTRDTLLWLLALTVATAFLLRRRRALLKMLRRRFVDTADTRSSAHVRGRLLSVVSRLLRPALLWIAILLGSYLILRLARPVELVVARDLLMLWASLSLLVAGLDVSKETVARRVGATGAALAAKVTSSARLVGFYLLSFLGLLRVADVVIGRGHLYGLLVLAAWLLAAPLAYFLLFRFRRETREAWLSHHPEGSLARGLSAYGLGPLGFPFLLTANVRLGVGGIWSFGQSLLLGFEHTRRGLAYLFRRRLERVAEATGHGAADPSLLPAELREAFSADVLEGAEVDELPELDDVRQAFVAWDAGGPSLDVALVGEQGAGKSAWLVEMEQRAAPMTVIRAALSERLLTERAVCLEVGKILGLEGADNVDALVAAVAALERRQIVLLDHAELLMLRCVGGMEGMEAFSRILRRTSEQLVWVCSFTRSMWDHLRFVMRGTDVFQRSVELTGFSEERIGELVERRLERCGYEISYEDILPRGVRDRDRPAELERVRQRYLRLLWDYSDGMPQVALDYWLRSLVIVDAGRARVRLFAAPKPEELERLHEGARFTLHAVMSHESLSVDEAARVLAWPETECLSILELLRSQKVIARNGTRYRVTARYNRAVVRHLRRQHLIHAGTGVMD